MKKRKEEERYEREGTDIMRRALKEREMTQVDLADKLGVMQSTVSMHFSRIRIGLDVFLNVLDTMEYDVIVVDRKTGEKKWKVIQKEE